MRDVDRLAKSHRADRAEQRKADTQRKIQLGGLVIKAGLGSDDAAFVLGALLTAAESKGDPTFRSYMRRKGQEAFKASERSKTEYTKAF